MKLPLFFPSPVAQAMMICAGLEALCILFAADLNSAKVKLQGGKANPWKDPASELHFGSIPGMLHF